MTASCRPLTEDQGRVHLETAGPFFGVTAETAVGGFGFDLNIVTLRCGLLPQLLWSFWGVLFHPFSFMFVVLFYFSDEGLEDGFKLRGKGVERMVEQVNKLRV